MKCGIFTKTAAVTLAAAVAVASFAFAGNANAEPAENSGNITINDMPQDFKGGADWIWQNRIVREKSTERRNTLFDQIVAGKGTINYVVRWQSYKTVTYQQRQDFERMASDCINAWNDCLANYENWPYKHINVKIVGWAVLDENSLLDRHPDEVVYTNLTDYNSSGDTSNGVEKIPDKLPNAPDNLSRMYHFDHSNDPNFDAFNYPGGLDKRFDMYLWATQGFPSIGGCGGDWGQRLSDNAYIAMLGGENLHVLEHELGHGFGMTDFYGGEGDIDGFPPGGFPGGENSIMMAGSAMKITEFDKWMLRYMWTKIKNDSGRFDLKSAVEPTQAPTDPPTQAPTQAPTEPPVPERVPYDVNGDGVFDIWDIKAEQDWVLKKIPLKQQELGDMNQNYLINAKDLTLMKQKYHEIYG